MPAWEWNGFPMQVRAPHCHTSPSVRPQNDPGNDTFLGEQHPTYHGSAYPDA
ncbi:MAG TPA: hypothetical protein QF753_22825 [Victivallales bacterium]|nr:hypothetical protein [Victivallales bacterium]